MKRATAFHAFHFQFQTVLALKEPSSLVLSVWAHVLESKSHSLDSLIHFVWAFFGQPHAHKNAHAHAVTRHGTRQIYGFTVTSDSNHFASFGKHDAAFRAGGASRCYMRRLPFGTQ